jgi:TetR/AcrR family transcriptional regulator, regulator of cefoperazone and chloramphenicol sensitivity
MGREKMPMKQKIILAAIECIERNGIQSLTIRDIAQAAGINVAAINYYFGSKKNLLETTLQLTMDEAYSEFESALRDPDIDPYHTLKAFLENTLWGSMNSPGVTKAHLFNPIYEKDKNNYAFQRNKEFIKLLVSRLAPKSDTKARKQMKFAVVQMIAAVVMVGIIPEIFEQASSLDFHKDKTQKEFVAYVLEKYFPDR